MSIRIMAHIWQYSTQKGSALLTLLAIADMANDDGECELNRTCLAQQTRMTEHRLQTILRKLKEAGELQIIPNEDFGYQYKVIISEGTSGWL